MPVDVSSYPTGQPEQQNPLQVLSTLQSLRTSGLENQLLQRTMAAKQALGTAAQGATGADGSFDPNAYTTAVKADPNAAFAAPEAVAFAQEQRQAQLAQHVAQIELGMKQNAFMVNQLGSLADKPGVTGKDIASLAGTLVQNGIIDAKMAATELQGMPTDPTKLPDYLRGLQKRAMESGAQIALYHQKVMTDLGGTIAPVNTAPLGQQEPLAKTMSPGEAATPVQGPVDASGAPTVMPKGQFASVSGPIKVGLSPGQTSAQGTMGTGNAQEAMALQQTANQAPDMKAALANMTGDLGQFATGPGSAGRNHFMAAVNSMFGGGFDAERVASQEGFDKLAAQVASRQRQALGLSGTDLQTSMIAHASPGSELSSLGNKTQIAIIKGNADAIATKNQLWQRYQQNGNGAETYGQWSSVINKHLDPLVFQYQYMTDPQKKALVGAMSPAEKQNFTSHLDMAIHNGWVK